LRAQRGSASLDGRDDSEEAAVSDATGQPADGAPAEERPESDQPWAPAGASHHEQPPAGAATAEAGGAATAEAGDTGGTAEASVPAPPPRQESPAVAATPDVNLEAIERAALDPQYASWLREVALQVDARLDRVEPGWRAAAQAPAARACAFGLLVGQLANDYPHVTDQLSRVVEAHPSFGSLGSGRRLDTLREIARDRPRLSAWLSPLVDAQDPEAVQRLLD
jgi:hypothetical protein